MRRVSRLASAATGAVLWAASASGQAPSGAIFEGQIVDNITGEPIAGVLVRMDVGAETFTDPRGAFRLVGLPQGRRLFALLSADCRITWGRVDVIEGIPRRVRLRLPPAFGAAAAEERRDAAQRVHTGGKRVERAEIERMAVHSITDLLRRVAPNMVGPVSGYVGAGSAIMSRRNRSFEGEAIPPVLVIDGMRIPDAQAALYGLLASDVEVLEVLPSAAAGWEFGSAGAGGVIRIRLRKGLATGAPERAEPTECFVPEFPGR